MGTRLFTLVAALLCCGLAWGQPDAGGCTDIAACNYDSSATNDDGTCTYPGCTDSSACNYDATAGCDDSSCVLPDAAGACDCFLDCAADLTIECGDSIEPENTGSPIVSGGCDGEGGLSYFDEVSGDDCEQIITRTWSLLFEDQPIAECVQIITVVDSEGPVFLETPEDITLECIEDVPAPAECIAEDACTSVVDTEIFTSETGTPLDSCALVTAIGPGPDWSIWLPLGDDVAPSPYWSFSEMGYFISYDDGTAHLYGDVVNNGDAALGVYLDVWFENAADWTTWSDLGRWYKDDLGLAAAGGNLWETWTYYELVNGFSTVTGTSGLSGTVELYHMPVDYFFGFQCGEAANVKNGNEGLSGWFTFEGTMNGMDVSGNGDINVDKECVEVPLSTCPNDNEFTYFWRAEDACGNASIISQIITVEDTTAPEVLNCPEDITVECDALDTLPDADEQTAGIEATDNCDNSTVTITYEGQFPGEGMVGDCEYTLLRRWRVEDECDNFTICVQTITVQDTTAPELEIAADVTIECDQEVPAAAWTASDNCSEITEEVTEVTVEGDCPNNYTIERTYSVTDACGNNTSATQIITVQDTTAPVFDEYPVTLTVDCGDLDSVEPLTATDNCDEEVTIEVETTDGSGGCPGTIVYEYTATDDCGNSTSATQFVTLTDTIAPVINNPEDMMIECDEVGDLPDPNAIEITDNCDEEVTVTFEEIITEGFCEDQYTITWTWTAEDDCENTTTATTTITVSDTTAPTWVEGTLPADVTVECSDELPAVGTPEAEDNCDDEVEIEVTEEIIPGDCPNNYVIQRIYRGFDNCGNQVLYAQEITVQDTTAPELEIAEDVTVECDQEIPAAAWEASDNCSEELIEEVTEVIVDGDCPNNYTIERTYSVTDECGNNTSATQIITVQDTTAPELEIAEDMTIECDQDVPAPEWTSADNCGDTNDEVSEEIIEGECPQEYTLIRTYTVTDLCGNSTTATQTITVQDTTAPVIEAEAFLSMPCDMVDDSVLATATDNCDEEVELTYEDTSVSGGCAGNVLREYTAVDDCGNTTSFTQVISLIDETAPEASDVPADVTVECDEEIPGGEPTFSDNCDEELDLSYEETVNELDCFYEIVQCWTAVDHCTNATTVCRTITVTDTTAPSLEVAADLDLDCNDEIPAAAWEASDNCDEELEEMVSEEIIEGDCAANYTLVRTYTVTDDCGNSTSATQTITVSDTTAPSLEVAGDVTIECDEEVPAADWTASDDCSEITEEVSEEIIPGDCPVAYTLVRTYTVTDACGNATSAVQNITVLDTTAPELEIAADVTIECDQEVPAAAWTASDNCSEITEEVTEVTVEGDCPNNYTIERTYSVTDACGNNTSATQIITVQDTTAPVIEGEEFITMPCGDIDEAFFATATDNCDEEVELTYEDTSVSGGCAGNVLREYTAVDDCGNTTSFTQVISLIDETAPEASDVPADVTVECDEEIPGGEPTFLDNCDEELDLSYEETVNELDCFYEIVQCWTAVDHCTNATTVCRTITVTDTTAPSLEVAADLDLDCNDEIPAAAWEASDNCDEELEEMVSEEIIEGDCAANYTLVRTYTVTDDCGNSTSATQTITVSDTTAPSLEVAGDVTIECDEEVPAADWTASDDCSEITEEVSEEIIPGDCPVAYTLVRTYTVTDACGNATSAVQNITVLDTTAPELEIAADVTIECDQEVPAAAWTASDNCSEITEEVTEVTVEGDCPNNYTIERTYSVTDACGNNTSATQIITVQDTTAPSLEIAADVTIECDEDVPAAAWTASDNCAEELTEVVDEEVVDGDCPNNYTILRTYTVTDACGNNTSATQTITVQDTTAPSLEIAADVTIECDEEVPAAAWTASDNCSDELVEEVTEVTVEGDCPNNYTIERTYSVTDACGNNTSATQIITVQDTTAPSLEVAADVTIECADEIPAAAWEASDNCSETTDMVEESIIDGDCPAEYTIVRTYTATDACGNSTSAVQNITVVDTTAPEFTFVPQNSEYSCDAEIPAFQAEAEDACSEVTVTSSEEVIPGDCPQSYSVIITWTATDACGNAAEAQTTYAVYDNEAPVILDDFSDLVFECADEVPDFTECNAVDNCDEEVEVTVSMEVIGEDECGNYEAVVTCTAVDDCGNASSTSFVVTVLDETAPEFVEAPADLVLDCEDEVPAPAELTAVDNCGGEVSISYTEEQFGDVPNPDAVQDCNLVSPISPYYNPDWALWLQSFPGGEYFTLLNGEFLLWEDNSATITGSVVSVDNPQAGFDFVVQLDNGLDWEGWSTQDFPTGYKDDFNAAGDSYLDWMYFIINGDLSSLSGWGDLDGVELTIAHAPASFYYGYQLGVAANNVNSNYGSGGWIYYEGTVDGEPVEGAGDFAFDHDCCPDYSIVRTWCAMDCSGNETCVEQTITFEDLGDEEEVVFAPGSDLTDTTGDIDIMAIAPNPTNTNTTVKIASKRTQTITLEVYDLSGRKVATLFNQRAEADVAYILNFGADALESGVYSVRLSSSTEQVVEKLIVGK